MSDRDELALRIQLDTGLQAIACFAVADSIIAAGWIKAAPMTAGQLQRKIEERNG